MNALAPLVALLALMVGCADVDPRWLAPCNATRLPAPARPIVCPDRVIRYAETALEPSGAPRCIPFMATPCRCSNGAQGVDTCSSFGRPMGCFCDLPSDPRDIEGRGGPPPPLPPRLLAPISGMRATSMRPMFRWMQPETVGRARIELCDDRPCTRVFARVDVIAGAWRPDQPLRPGVVFWRVIGLNGTGAAVWTSATWEVSIPYRDTPVDSVNGPIRDVNGDAVDDLVIRSAYQDELDYLSFTFVPGYRGAAHDIAPTVFQLDREWFSSGYDAALGDVNGDGISDLLTVTSLGGKPPRQWQVPGVESYNPTVGVLLGGRECPFSSRVEVPVPLTDRDGVDTGSIGDFDGDGFGDVAAASYRGLYLVRGSERGPRGMATDFVSFQVSNAQDSGLRFVGDVDGDGYSDLALGNYTVQDGDGEVRVLFGNPRARLDERVQVLRPHGGEFGRSITAADFTGDGLSDLVVGSYQTFDLYAGDARGLRFAQQLRLPQGTLAATGIPFFFPIAGDMDADGLPELFTFAGGLVYRSIGAAGFFPTPVARYREWVPDNTVASDPVGSPGDLNADGYDELLARRSQRQGDESTRSLLVHLGGSIAVCAPVRAWRIAVTWLVDGDVNAIHP